MDIVNCKRNLGDLDQYFSQYHQNLHSALFEKISSESLGHILDLPVFSRSYFGTIPTNDYIRWFGKDTPIEKSPAGHPDINGRCYNFGFIAEATRKTDENQCAQEYASNITHFREFIARNQINPRDAYILFITPKLHNFTYITLKNSRRDHPTELYQIIPIETSTLTAILEIKMMAFTIMRVDLRMIFNTIYSELYESTSLENFRRRVINKIKEWKNDVLKCEKNACFGLLVYDLMQNQERELDITELEIRMKHKRKIQQFSKFAECDITDTWILDALLTNGFARKTGRSFGNVERVEFVPNQDINNRFERYKLKLESLA